MNTVLIKFGAIALVLCAIIGLTGYKAYHIGKSVQESSDHSSLDTANKTRDAAIQDAANMKTALDKVNAQAKADEKTAQAQQARAEQLQKDLTSEQVASAEAEKAWARRFQKAQSNPDCKTLEEQLCDSVMDY